MKPRIITITGAAGQIGYSLLPRITGGGIFGPGEKIFLKLLEIPRALKVLEGIAMELEDCAFKTLAGIEITDDPKRAFTDSNWVILAGSRPRLKGMERKDLLELNAPIFAAHGKAINDFA